MRILDRTAAPRSSSPLNATWIRITGKNDWRDTHAVIYSVEWRDLREAVVSSVGYYQVVYYYKVEGERYIGNYTDLASRDEDYFHTGDEFLIRYNPRNPSKSYYPEARNQSRFRLASLLIGIVIACIVLLITLLT